MSEPTKPASEPVVTDATSSVTPTPSVTSVTPAPPATVIPTAPPVLEEKEEKDLDPLEALDDPTVDDPDPEIVEDEKDPNYIAPAKGISPRKKV